MVAYRPVKRPTHRREGARRCCWLRCLLLLLFTFMTESIFMCRGGGCQTEKIERVRKLLGRK